MDIYIGIYFFNWIDVIFSAKINELHRYLANSIHRCKHY